MVLIAAVTVVNFSILGCFRLTSKQDRILLADRGVESIRSSN